MSKYRDKTSIGGRQESFQTTQWSELYRAETTNEDRRSIIIDTLLDRYWKPVYCYIRRKGYDNEQAKDLTQGFFHDVVLDSDLIRQADRKKGRFRTFLLTALDHYLIDAHRKEKSKKNYPKGRIIQLETDDLVSVQTTQSTMNPEQFFNYVWATEFIDNVISLVEKECCNTRKEIHWRVFYEKIIIPIIDNTPSPSLKIICNKYGIENEIKASNMIITVKRCFRRILEDNLRRFVQTEEEIETEFNELFEIIASGRAG